MNSIKVCTICAKPFTANYDARVTCSKPCCIVHLRVKMAGRIPHKAVKAHALKRRKQAEAKALDLFGALTAREVAIFNHAARVGYKRGYAFGKHREEAV